MSPTRDDTLQPRGDDTLQPYSILPERNMLCEVCNTPCPVSVCCNCYKYGHAECLGFQVVENWGFCRRCAPEAIQEYQDQVEKNNQEQWERLRKQQLENWKNFSLSIQDLTGTFAVNVAGLGSTVASGALSAVSGLASGIVAGSTR